MNLLLEKVQSRHSAFGASVVEMSLSHGNTDDVFWLSQGHEKM